MAFSDYNNQFPYSDITQRMMNLLPGWMKMVRDRASVGQQFMNAVVGIELEKLEEYLDELLNNQFIGKANLGQISWIYKASYEADLNAHSAIIITGIEAGTGDSPVEVNIDEADSIREFYEASPVSDIGIFDYENKILYLRKNYDSVTINEETIDTIELHHVWNSFDELGLLVGLMRYQGESNSSFKDRILNVMRYPGDATKIGLTRYIAGQLGLIKTVRWLAEDETLPLTTAIEGTVKIGNEFVPNGQIQDGILTTQIPIFPRFDFYEKNNIDDSEVIRLPHSVLKGIIKTPVIYPANLDSWDKILVDYEAAVGTSIKCRVLDIYDNIVDEYEISSSEQPVINSVEAVDFTTGPIKLEIIVSRPDTTYSSPIINSIKISYEHAEYDVTYIDSDDISLDTFFEGDFLDTMFNADGSPTEEMENYVRELSDVAPILWDRFIWDEAYWDVVSQNLMGLDVLPNKWDPDITSIANKYLQVGIGDKNDLLVKMDKEDWTFNVFSGYYYIGDKLDEYYLYANPTVHTEAGPTDSFTIGDIPKQGEPIHIEAMTGDSTPQPVELKQIAFLDDDYEYTLENKEVIEAHGKEIYVSYADIDIDSVEVKTIEDVPQVLAIDSGSYDGKNVITLDDDYNGQVEVTYKVKDSFYVELDDDSMTIYLSDSYTDIKVTYESDTDPYYNSNINLSPTTNHIDHGFLFITNQTPTVSDIKINISPDIVVANGFDRALVIIDVVDQYGNPVFDEEVDVIISGEVMDVGTIELSGQHYNRYVYRYTAPESVNDPTTIEIEVTAGAITRTAEIKVR